MITQEQLEKIIEIGFDYYRNKHGFPYEELTPIQLWYEFFRLKNSYSRIMKSSKKFFRFKSIEVNGVGTKIADSFHTHIFESHAIGMRSAINAYNDDVCLKKAIRLVFEQNMPITNKSTQRMLRLVNGTQICSNFRPIAAKTIYSEYVKDGEGDILDPSTGYGGRLLGYLACDFKHSKYVGVDPNTKTHKANKRLSKFLESSQNIELYNLPFEEFDAPKNRFQLAFTSPPYFKKEIYSNESTQSCNRYTEYDDWLKYFWIPAIKKVKQSLKNNGHFIINIQDIKIKSKLYPLVNDTKSIMNDCGFKYIEQIDMLFPGFGKNLLKRKYEPILIFKKLKENCKNAEHQSKRTRKYSGKSKKRTRKKRPD